MKVFDIYHPKPSVPKKISVGQFFRVGMDIYYLVVVDHFPKKVMLINASGKNYWSNPVVVSDPFNLTEEEFKRIVNEENYSQWEWVDYHCVPK